MTNIVFSFYNSKKNGKKILKMRKIVLKSPICVVLHDIFSNFVSIFNVHEEIEIMLRIPTITKNLLIINVLAFLATFALKSVVFSGGLPLDLNDVLGLHFFLASDFRVYQLVTYMFMHANIEHIFFNMFALWMFGCVVENVWGSKKFLFYYISCGVGAGLFQELAQFCSFYLTIHSQDPSISLLALPEVAAQVGSVLNSWTTVGASGAIYAILLAFGMIFPNERIFIFPLPIPIKAKWFVIIYAAVELFSAMATSGDGVAHIAHLGGMVFGFFMIRYWKHHVENGYGRSRGEQFFQNLHSRWEKRKGSGFGKFTTTSTGGSTRSESDWDYNARKRREQEEIDRILDKIRKSGYDSLSAEEKTKLFNQSKK